jgi:O-antigen/teichoic acid export membrane protein
MSLSRQASRQYLFSVLMYPLFFVAANVSAAVLSKDGRGLLSTAHVIPNTLLIVADLGMGVAVFYMIGRRKMREEDVASALLAGGLIVGTLISGGVAATYLLFPDVLPPEVTGVQRFTLAAQIPFAVLANYLSNLLVWRGCYGRNFIIALGSKLLNIALTVGVAVAVASSAGVPVTSNDADHSRMVDFICIGMLVVAALSAFAQAWFVRDLLWRRQTQLAASAPCIELPELPPKHGALRGYWKLLAFGWPQAFTLGAMYLLHYGDQYYLSKLLPEGERIIEVGVYTTAVSLLTIVSGIPRAVGVALLRPSMEAEEADSARMVALTAKRTAMLTAAVSCLVALVAPLAVWSSAMFNAHEFEGAATALRILVIAPPLYALGDIASTTSVHKGAVIASFWPVAVACALNVWLDILWIPSDGPLHGMIGASWATVIAFAVLCALHVAIYWWYAGWENTKELLTPKVADVRFIAREMKDLTMWMLRAARILRRPA